MEIDYQVALLLQHKLEKEAQQSKQVQDLVDSDFAKSLQNDFNKENELETEGGKLSYNQKSKKHSNPSKSLVDPSWEVIDPTPDIHILFMAFNERFFWNKLLAVCVSWSKRMTSAAGLCTYREWGGMCSISLSEPLLKLRPRKDLVETLLHEMIHAYLFVTNNNRDRDGHGMEFQKHMFRINAESGTNITIYHDFHDEVRLYKQHWWRCDGPCQKWKPYYGIVKRATNRAPGPNDRWWGEHSRSCGGNYIKIKEPETPQNKTKKTSDSSSKTSDKNIVPTSSNDIRTFFPPAQVKPHNSSTTKSKSSVTSTVTSTEVAQVISKSSNIFGFTQLNNTNTNNPQFYSTIFNNNLPNTNSKNKSSETSFNSTNNEKKLNSTTSSSDSTDYSRVRNAWINKFPSTSGVKRSLSQSDDSKNSNKFPKMSNDQTSEKTVDSMCKSSNTFKSENSEQANCPVCDKIFDINELNSHLDMCLETRKDVKECIICGKQIETNLYENHVVQCSQDTFDDDTFGVNDNINTDLKKEGASSKNNVVSLQLCEVCEKMVESNGFEIHINDCLNRMYDNLIEKNSNTVSCLACDKTVPKDELNAHLENCNGLSRIFDDDNMPIEEN